MKQIKDIFRYIAALTSMSDKETREAIDSNIAAGFLRREFLDGEERLVLTAKGRRHVDNLIAEGSK